MMNYAKGEGAMANWLVEETDFNSKYQGKCEAAFCQGNGYFGIRCATEEGYFGQTRDFFVAGTFNKFDEFEVTELPNAADFTAFEIWIDGELFSLEKGSFENYSRTLNLKNGEVVRQFIWTNKDRKSFSFEFKRFASQADLHAFMINISIKAIDCKAVIEIHSGLNGQMSNSGAQHFHEGEKRIYEKVFLQMLQETTQSEITFFHNVYHKAKVNKQEVASRFAMDRRKVFMIYKAELLENESVNLTKHANLYTSRDKEYENNSIEQLKEISLEKLKFSSSKTYETLLKESADAWDIFWKNTDITIKGKSDFDQLAIRFAMYHLKVMTPAHDNRMGIGAKGFSGEGYKGHSFWDTELFMLPFFSYTFPEIGKSLMEYRYKTLAGAHKKAKENGYKGAMYPWESAWMDDGEVTPVWGAADVVTGKSTKIWSGFIEQHITSDVSFGVWQYYNLTGDEAFMENCGYEILLDTGIFWASRFEWNEEKNRFHINNVIGPDEYKEHVNNDAFTNYTAYWCVENAINFYHKLKETKPAIFEKLNKKLDLDAEIPVMKDRLSKFYLPQPNEQNIIPQDDTYLSKQIIDLTKYKNQTHLGSLFLDYSLDQVNQIQVSKQASIVMLMYLLEHKFSNEVKLANYNYYEPKTLHDSSLSLSTHAILANDLGDQKLAYNLYKRTCEIDLGPNMKSSDHGIHAASLGGIWQITVCGFGGVRLVGEKLRISPALPDEIDEIEFKIHWKSTPLRIKINKSQIRIENIGEVKNISLSVFEKEYNFDQKLEIEY